MASDGQNGMVSDAEASERPVREQLKKASISKATGDMAIASDVALREAADLPGEGEAIVDEEDNEERDEDGDDLSRGRSQKTKSLGDEDAEEHHEQITATSSTRQHTRKRSRDSTAEEEELNNGQRKSLDRARDAADTDLDLHGTSNGHPKAPTSERPHTPEHTGEKRGEAAVEQMTSPKTKRSRLQAVSNEKEDALAPIDDTVPTKESDEPEVDKRAASPPLIPPSSGFANSSAVSPFATLSSPKSPPAEPQTSASVFAASGFSALSGSSSGFGAIGKSSGGFGSGGTFATSGKNPTPASEGASALGAQTTLQAGASTASSSAFGGALGQSSVFSSAPPPEAAGSSFGSGASEFGASGFGKVSGSGGFGSGFGGAGFGALGSNGGLTSFASGKPSLSLAGSSKPVKLLGSQVEDEEKEAEEEADDGDDSGIRSPLSQESDKQDERFYKQELETGEEDESTEYSCRAKLYSFAMKKEWKERGLGVVRLNVKKPAPGDGDSATPRARLLMRAEGSHRVILNTPVKKEIKFGAPTGGPPQGGFVYFMGTVDGLPGLTLLQLKVRQQFALELYDKITELQETM